MRVLECFSVLYGLWAKYPYSNNVFINAGCKFQDQGGIYIEDGVLIGHNAVLATINHMEDPEKRAGMILQPEQL